MSPRREPVIALAGELTWILVVAAAGSCVAKLDSGNPVEGSVELTVAGPPPSFAGTPTLDARQRPGDSGPYESALGLDFVSPQSLPSSAPRLRVRVDIPGGSYRGQGTYRSTETTAGGRPRCTVTLEDAIDGHTLPGEWDVGPDPGPSCEVEIVADQWAMFLGNVTCSGLVFDAALAALNPGRLSATHPDQGAAVDLTASWSFPQRVSFRGGGGQP